MDQEGTDLARSDAPPHNCETVALRIAPGRLSDFFPMLQRGVLVQVEVDRPLKELLSGQFGIPEEYVAGRITTIFLDNRPVDDLERSLIHQGSRVTLSAAMPGLVGATMRRSGFYATLRQGISHAERGGELKGGQGTVRLKLFNLLLPELAPLILARGILLPRAELARLLEDSGASGRSDLAAAQPGERDESGWVHLTVAIAAVAPQGRTGALATEGTKTAGQS